MIGSKPKPEWQERQGLPEEPMSAQQLTTADMVAASRAPQASADFTRRDEDSTSRATTKADTQMDALLDHDETENLRSQWERIQTGFVDEPRLAVEQADKLVAATMSRLAEVFATERESLEREWAKGEDVSTEDLRVALRRYRSFFDRLLSV